MFFSRTEKASTKNAINLNKLAALVGDNDEDLDLDLLAKVKESRDFAVPYGNMGCGVSCWGIQNNVDFF